jgi:GTP cyclohydrolase II
MAIPPPLVRIHSECFTGETVGSMRCDCGEQLDEAIRLMSQPIAVSGTLLSSATTIPGRGAVVYLRQEGRGIGLLSKIRAYNLQDLGHDTVTANLMLGHQADEREYEAAAAILRDLGLVGGVRLLTNNPDKVLALESEGVRVEQRVPMVPRSWRQRRPKVPDSVTAVTAAMTMVNVPSMDVDEEKDAFMEEGDRFHGAHVDASTLVGGRVVEGADLDKYLRTKVLRMGHMLPLLED